MVSLRLTVAAEATRGAGRGEGPPGGDPVPPPGWTSPATVAPESGAVGASFTATPGVITGGTLMSRAWLLNGTALGGESGLSVTPPAAGTLVHREYATGPGGERFQDSAAVTVEAEPAQPAGTITAMVMGQSELEYLFNPSSFYKKIPFAEPGDGNLVLFQQNMAGDAPVRVAVSSATIAAGQVNPAMAALSAFLDFAAPGVKFALSDGAVQGTSRYDLADDTTDQAEAPTRLWSDFASVAGAIESEFGPVGHLIENWYNADRGQIPTFRQSFWPFYFGAGADGTPFALGGTVDGRQIDHCLYDGSAEPEEKGRGLFARAETHWHVITPMPFQNAPVDPAPEWSNFSEDNPALSEPARATIVALADDSLAQSVNLQVGPSAHLCKFGGGSSEIHPDVEDPDGQILLTWPIAIALLRASGMNVGEPTVVDIEGPADGSYADIVVDLPNGGDLTTLAALRGTAYPGSAPHQQAVTGVEITRQGGERRPVYRSNEVGYPPSHRGTVAIVDVGSGSPRRGRVRVTPEEAFGQGDAVSLLRGQATAALLEPRDFDLHPWFPIEHVPALYDAHATYPMEGIAVRPYQDDLAVFADDDGDGGSEPVDGPTQWLVTNGGYLVDPANVPAGTTRITYRGTFRFGSVDGLYYPFNQESTGCDLRVSNGTLLSATVEDSEGTKMLASTEFAGAALAPGVWYDIAFDVDMVAEMATLAINGTSYPLAFAATGTGTFQSSREVAFLAGTNGSSIVPAATEFADLSVAFNGTLHKAISNDATAANADPWKQGAAFSQGA